MSSRFLESLLKVSEKAANIARVIRQDEHLFKLLVQEKKGSEKNPRFVQDFKTLADVLIQETVKHDIGKQFPAIADHIQGEESNTFCNTLGDTITVEVQVDQQATAALLSTVLSGDTQAADILAAEVHRDLSTEKLELEADLSQLNLPLDKCGIWIDPIDSTAEYISGEEVKSPVSDIYQCGLRCVTVLIGVFDRLSGQPVVGVINQPFHVRSGDKWHGRCEWGVKCGDVCAVSPSLPSNAQHTSLQVVALSSNEGCTLQSRLRDVGYSVAEAAGAGYKQLCVVRGNADVYVLSRGSTFRWDTCGPHAILQALGGGIVTYKDGKDLTYTNGDNHCHSDGLIAYRNSAVLAELRQVLGGKS